MTSVRTVLFFCLACSVAQAQHVFEFFEDVDMEVIAELELARLPATADDVVRFEMFHRIFSFDGQEGRPDVYDGVFDESIGEFTFSANGGLTHSEGREFSIIRDVNPPIVAGSIPADATLLSLDLYASGFDFPSEFTENVDWNKLDRIEIRYEHNGEILGGGRAGYWQPIPEPSSLTLVSIAFAVGGLWQKIRGRSGTSAGCGNLTRSGT